MMPESKKQEASVKDIFGNIANYMEFTRAGCGPVAGSTGRCRIQTGY